MVISTDPAPGAWEADWELRYSRSKLKYSPIKFLPILSLVLCGIISAGNLDVRYDLSIDFHPADDESAGRIIGSNRIHLTNHREAELSEIYICRTAGATHTGEENASINITGIRSTSLERSTVDSGDVVRLGIFPALGSGESIIIDVAFETRLGRQADTFAPTLSGDTGMEVYNLVNFYPRVAPFNGEGWQRRDFGHPTANGNPADYEIAIEYPARLAIVSAAHCARTDTLTNTRIRKQYYANNSRGYSAVLAEGFIHQQLVIDDISVELLFPPSEAAYVPALLAQLADLNQFYAWHFGACPHDKLAFAVVHSLNRKAAAYPNLIVLQDNFREMSELLPQLFARQWFGNSLTTNASRESWLMDSFAEYAAGGYQVERAQTPAGDHWEALRIIETIWRDFDDLTAEEIMRMLHRLLGQSVIPPLYEPEQSLGWENQALLYSRIVAGRQALQMLQAAVGDSLMREIMLDFVRINRNQSVSTDRFISVIETHSVRATADRFRLALTTGLRPDFSVDDVQTSGRKDRRWNNRIITDFDGDWSLPVDLEIVTTANDTILRRDQYLHPDQDINLITDSHIKSVVLDPDNLIYDANRFNNRWPRSIRFQPIYGLPSWEVYKFYYRPQIRQDWRGLWRFGAVINGGLGLNLQPILPAYYRHSFELEASLAPVLAGEHQLGVGITYRTPLNAIDRTYWEAQARLEYPRNTQSLAFSRYLGRTQYLVAHRRSAYQRLTGKIRRTEFFTTAPNRDWLRGKLYTLEADLVRFRYDRTQRSNLQLALVIGRAVQQRGGDFIRLSAMADVERHAGHLLILRAHFENGLVWDERSSNYLRYRLEHKLRAWRPRDDFVPLFRGFTPVEDQRWNSVVGGGFSIGVETNLPVWPMVYIDGALAGKAGGVIDDRWRDLLDNPVYAAAGIGLESQSVVELGLYLPLWISHPLNSGHRWGWRWLVQWGFYF